MRTRGTPVVRVGMTLALAAVVAACAGPTTPTAAPPTPEPTPAATASALPVANAEPTPVASAEPSPEAVASSAVRPSPSAAASLAAEPAVARRALGRGSRICVSNRTNGSLWVDRINSNGPFNLGLIAPGGSGCQAGTYDRDPFQIIGSVFGSQYYEARGYVTAGRGGPKLAEFWAFNPWIGYPWLRADDRNGSFIDRRWSVGERAAYATNGYTVTVERVADSGDWIEWVITITRP